jgi:hypothetical protein
MIVQHTVCKCAVVEIRLCVDLKLLQWKKKNNPRIGDLTIRHGASASALRGADRG